jgi:hypothetical protein
MENEKKVLKITVKDLELEMSKEQALRTGIMQHLFKDRKDYDFEVKAKEKEINKTDMQGIRIVIKDLSIIGY